MRRHISLLALLLAWLCANGAMWNVVQLVAWAKMFHDNAQEMSTTRAIEVTFNGTKPCELCQVSRAAQETGREQLPRDAALGGAEKIILALHVSAPPVLNVPETAWPGVVHDTGLTRTDPVPVRPPRV